MLLLACATGPTPHRDLGTAWREYQALPAQRALAISGEPQRDRWVTGASGGHATREQAESEALAQCRKLRAQRRLQTECVLYAVGDEIVWRVR